MMVKRLGRAIGWLAGTALILAMVPSVSGANSAKLPRKLDEMLDIALRANPQVLMAESKLGQAQVELLDVRLRVTQEVLEYVTERKIKTLELDSRRDELAREHSRVESAVVSEEKLMHLTFEIGKIESALTKIEGRLMYLLGWEYPTGSRAPKSTKKEETVGAIARRPSIPQKYASILERRISVAFVDVSMAEALEKIATEVNHEVSLVLDRNWIEYELGAVDDIRMTVELVGVSLRGTLQALADLYDLAFVIRDYGFLMTTPRRASKILAATVPADLALDPHRYQSR